MKYTHQGRSHMWVSKICLGTMFFGNRTPEEKAHKIMDRCLEPGINFFDTANLYGPNGKSEEIIGRWFKQDPSRRDKVVLAIKVYGQMDLARKGFEPI